MHPKSENNVQRIAAFSHGETGGNPAGVMIAPQLPTETEMQRIAAEVGFSETAFAAPNVQGWRVRYFAPESEVPFCGHATVALGAALAQSFGGGVFHLTLNQTEITVEGSQNGAVMAAALQSPSTRSRPAPAELLSLAREMFGYALGDLDPKLPPALMHAGADHLMLALGSRQTLTAMRYTLDTGRDLMRQAGLATIMLVYAESAQCFHSRNAFASGGVYEDPATGAATAAFAGYLRDINWPHGGKIKVVQGEDMGMTSHLSVEFSPVPGSSVRVSGTARRLDS